MLVSEKSVNNLNVLLQTLIPDIYKLLNLLIKY